MSRQISLIASTKHAARSAILGSLVAAPIWAFYVVASAPIRHVPDLGEVMLLAVIALVPGLIYSVPISILVGSPIVFLLKGKMVSHRRAAALILTALGGLAGWCINRSPGADDWELSGWATSASVVFGSIVGGAHAILLRNVKD